MNKLPHYQIIVGQDSVTSGCDGYEDLASKVNKAISEGYWPIGGLEIKGKYYFQAVVSLLNPIKQ